MPDPEVDAIIVADERLAKGCTVRVPFDLACRFRTRILLAMINEGARVLG